MTDKIEAGTGGGQAFNVHGDNVLYLAGELASARAQLAALQAKLDEGHARCDVALGLTTYRQQVREARSARSALAASERKVAGLEAESAGRLKVLEEKAAEAAGEWRRAEKAEAERDAARAQVEELEADVARLKSLVSVERTAKLTYHANLIATRKVLDSEGQHADDFEGERTRLLAERDRLAARVAELEAEADAKPTRLYPGEDIENLVATERAWLSDISKLADARLVLAALKVQLRDGAQHDGLSAREDWEPMPFLMAMANPSDAETLAAWERLK